MRSAQEVVGHQGAVMLLEQHQHGEVRVLARIFAEVVGLAFRVEFLQDDVAHGQRQRGIRALLGRQPDVAELHHFAVIGRDGHGFRALVAHFRVEVGVRRARHRHVRAPHHQIGRVVPVGRFRHVRLFAPHLRAGGRQVAVPVIKAQGHAANQRQVARAGGIADHGHGGNRREADDAVRAVFLDRQRIRGGDDFIRFVPRGAHEAAQATDGFVLLRAHGVLADPVPGGDGVHGLARFAPHFHQAAAHHRILHALRRIHVPGIAGAARAAARLVVGQVGPRARVIGLLGFPGDQAILDIHLPAARAGAVHAMRGTHDLVVLPALAIGIFPGAVFIDHGAMAVRERLGRLAKKFKTVQKVTHATSTLRRRSGARS